AHCEEYSLSCSNTIRTARSRTSGEYFFACLMTPISQRLEPPANPGRFNPCPKLVLGCAKAPVAHAGARKAGNADRPPLGDAVCGLDLLDDTPPLAYRHDLFPRRSFSTWRFKA